MIRKMLLKIFFKKHLEINKLYIKHFENRIEELENMNDFEEWDTNEEFIRGYIEGIKYAINEIKELG